jgi:hypothetical protein
MLCRCPVAAVRNTDNGRVLSSLVVMVDVGVCLWTAVVWSYAKILFSCLLCDVGIIEIYIVICIFCSPRCMRDKS